jgi:hypothetical protein
MYVDQAHFRQCRGGRDSARYGVRNIVEFQIEEDLETEARKRCNRPRTFGREEL